MSIAKANSGRKNNTSRTLSKTTLNDKNLYNYCDGNPVGRVDESGNFWAGAIFGKMVSQCGEMEICDLMYWHIFSKRKRRWYN